MSPGDNQAAAGTEQHDSAPDELTHLYKMSPTAGVATTDYASINATAIVALLLGVGSVLVMFGSFLLIIPLAGAICAIVALRQINGSNGTQVGRGLATGGLALALLIGGADGAYQSFKAIQARADEKQISALLEQIGQQLSGGQYEAVYEQTAQRFRDRVPQDTFVQAFRAMVAVPQLGKLRSIEWNGEPMVFETNADTGRKTALAMTLEHFENLQDPTRELMNFAKDGDHWALDDIPRMFPAEKPKTSQ
jgi:hypothetical protein